MDYLSSIKAPINSELSDFIALFNDALSHEDGMLCNALNHIRQRGGKRMRPMLILLMAKNFGKVTKVTQHAAVGLELLHTASLIHDDVVDESNQRRGQASVNATYNNKVAVLVGDYVLSTALLHVSFTGSEMIVRHLAQLGQTLSDGEILQLSNIDSTDISEEVYYDVIKRKTAALFEECAAIGALSTGASDDAVADAALFGQHLGMMFQIRDDIFDYYNDDTIGKPTGNDMVEGKLTLPVIYAVNSSGDGTMSALARKVKEGSATADEIAELVEFAKAKGGIDYAERKMEEYHALAKNFIDRWVDDDALKLAFSSYLDFVILRKS